MITLEDMCGNPVRITSVKPDGSFDIDVSVYQLPQYKSRLVKRNLRTDIESDTAIYEGLSMIFDLNITLDKSLFLARSGRKYPYRRLRKNIEFYEFVNKNSDRGVVTIRKVKDKLIINRLKSEIENGVTNQSEKEYKQYRENQHRSRDNTLFEDDDEPYAPELEIWEEYFGVKR